jgi:hypothetical protein
MSPDLTIEAVLADPIIRAVMRADCVEPKAFERLLRSTAKQVDGARPPLAPASLVAQQARAAVRGFCCA